MSAPQRLGISYRRATAVSIVLHLFVLAALFRVWTAPTDSGLREHAATEAVQVSQLTHSSRTPRVAAAAAAAARTATPEPARHATSHVHVRVVKMPTRVAAAPIAYVAPVAGHASATRPSERVAPTAVIVDATAKPAAATTAEPQTTATTTAAEATATPAPVVLAAAKSTDQIGEVPSGGWGESFARPIVADDDALASLRASIHAADLYADIAVDDTGHATHVTLPASLPDDERAEIEQRLLALRYVPAECNGLRCAATLRIPL